jgi:glycosyltransferase involved in cell wall biosynthesis
MVDPDRNAAAAARAAPPDMPDGYLVAAGKLNAAKGFDRLVDELADAECARPVVVAGEGPLAAHLSDRASARGIDLRLRGWVGGDDLLRLIRDATAVLLPSAWAEPLSRVLLESLSLGTPVIAWNTGGSAEAIKNRGNGWLVDGEDSLAAAVRDLDDPERVRAAGEAATRTAVSRFSPDAVYPQVVEQYRAAAAQVGRRFESAR